jgi:MFS superfamily sulfate permease-like transporter
VEYGILAGVAINIVMLLYPSARPTVQVQRAKVEKLICISIFVKSDLLFRQNLAVGF